MIPLDTKQRLGRKAFYFLLSRKTTTSLTIFLIGLVLLVAKGPLMKIFFGIVPAGSIAVSTSATVSDWALYITVGTFVLSVVLFVVGFVSAFIEYRDHTFTLGEFGIKINTGVMNKKEISVPYRQIQDIAISRSLGQQLLGLSSLVMMTAGRENTPSADVAKVSLEPIDKNLAQEISELLQRKIGVQVVESERAADTIVKQGSKV